MIVPSLAEFTNFADKYNVIPMYESISADTETPISIYLKLVGEKEGFILESVEQGEHLGRYSFIGLRPCCRITVHGQQCNIQDGKRLYRETGNPFAVLRTLLNEAKTMDVSGLPRFYGGAVGYFGYDMVENLERFASPLEDDTHLPDCCLMFPEIIVAVDHIKHVLQIIACVKVSGDPEKTYKRGLSLIQEAKERLGRPLPEKAKNPMPPDSVCSNRTKEEYMLMVEKAKEYIVAGDIFQVVLSQRLSTELRAEPFELYRALRSVNPSPYLYYLNFGDIKIVGSSPELLVKLENGIVETRPIAGSRKRGADSAEDEALKKELLADEKELAEHIMLVDLGRNDIGRVSQYGTVSTPSLLEVEKYSHIMHIVSAVQGKLQPGKDAIDALEACFPAGTLSGAPKVRAMEIIRELEGVKRGPYGGAVGYLGYSGNMDACIAIRTFVINGKQVYVQAGAGIVADSVPEKEYEETLNKAGGLLKALKIAEEDDK